MEKPRRTFWTQKPHSEEQNKAIVDCICRSNSCKNSLCEGPSPWLCKCFLRGDPVVPCLPYSSSLAVREVADTRVCSNGSPLPPPSCDPCGVTVGVQQPEAQGWAFLSKMKTQHMCTQLNKWTHARVTCSPAALQSLLLPFFLVQRGWAMCRLSATTTLQTVSLNFYRRAVAGSNLDFWFRHHTGFLWRLRPAVGNVFSTPDATVPSVYTVLSHNVCPDPTFYDLISYLEEMVYQRQNYYIYIYFGLVPS